MPTLYGHSRAALLLALLAAGGAPASGAEPPSPSAETAAELTALSEALQVLVVLSPSWDSQRGTAQRFERSTRTAPFHPVGSPLPAWLGRSGLGWRSDAEAAAPPFPGPRKQEGDGRAPAGVLSLAGLWGYAPKAPPGVRLPYRESTALDRCVDDISSPAYNQLVPAPADGPPPWRSAESLRLPTDHYKYLVVTSYNTRAPRPGAGSCIFLHVAPPPGGPTAGCTALAEADLLTVLRWLDPARHPVLLQLPTAALQKGPPFQLPPELLKR
jgi:D-alanyl-D-alanine dipeptidase